jgi:hypothetical protein
MSFDEFDAALIRLHADIDFACQREIQRYDTDAHAHRVAAQLARYAYRDLTGKPGLTGRVGSARRGLGRDGRAARPGVDVDAVAGGSGDGGGDRVVAVGALT